MTITDRKSPLAGVFHMNLGNRNDGFGVTPVPHKQTH
jgi:hypothetical protein